MIKKQSLGKILKTISQELLFSSHYFSVSASCACDFITWAFLWSGVGHFSTFWKDSRPWVFQVHGLNHGWLNQSENLCCFSVHGTPLVTHTHKHTLVEPALAGTLLLLLLNTLVEPSLADTLLLLLLNTLFMNNGLTFSLGSGSCK